MKFILFFNGPVSSPPPGQQQKIMRQWGAWFDGLVKNGIFESILPYNWPGKTISNGRVTKQRKADTTYVGCVINVRSETEAIEIAKKAPYVSAGGSIVIKPCFEVMPQTV